MRILVLMMSLLVSTSVLSHSHEDKKIKHCEKQCTIGGEKQCCEKNVDHSHKHHEHKKSTNAVEGISGNSNSPIVIQNCQPEVKTKIVYRDRVKWKTKVVYRDRVKWKTKVVYRDKPAKVKRKVVNKVRKIYLKKKEYNHSLSLLGMASKTKLESDEQIIGGNQRVETETVYEGDGGVMYQYDHNRLRFSIGGSLNGTGFLGAGFKF
jgi:hypothetical protein